MSVRFTVGSVPESDQNFTVSLAYGDGGETFDVDVTGMTRIRLQVQLLATDYEYGEASAWAGWTEVKFE